MLVFVSSSIVSIGLLILYPAFFNITIMSDSDALNCSNFFSSYEKPISSIPSGSRPTKGLPSKPVAMIYKLWYERWGSTYIVISAHTWIFLKFCVVKRVKIWVLKIDLKTLICLCILVGSQNSAPCMTPFKKIFLSTMLMVKLSFKLKFVLAMALSLILIPNMCCLHTY